MFFKRHWNRFYSQWLFGGVCNGHFTVYTNCMMDVGFCLFNELNIRLFIALHKAHFGFICFMPPLNLFCSHGAKAWIECKGGNNVIGLKSHRGGSSLAGLWLAVHVLPPIMFTESLQISLNMSYWEKNEQTNLGIRYIIKIIQ